MATTEVNALLAQFKLENDWNDDLISLNNFYIKMLQDNKSLLPDQKANIMKQLCLRVYAIPIKNLQDCLIKYQRVCKNCNVSES
ncbi:nesp047 [Neophasia sp. alphabaculovirus]|nr:nesp047 [Neophasia sp. alphabaculovirus]